MIDNLPLVGLDFETYYDQKTFSLSQRNMTTESYVRDDRFEVIMVGINIPSENEQYWVPNYKNAVVKELDALGLDKCNVLAHNMRFDGFILGDYYGIQCGAYSDTLMMARPLHGAKEANSLAALGKRYGLEEKGHEVENASGKRLRDFSKRELEQYGGYCMKDNRIMLGLLDQFLPHYQHQDLIVISETLRAFCWPFFEVDVPLLRQYIPYLEQLQEERLDKVCQLLDYKNRNDLAADLRSNQRFADVLTGLGYEVPMKDSKTAKNEDGTPKRTFAFAKNDMGFKALLETEDELLTSLCEARLGEKSTIGRTRAERFIGIGERGLIPFALEPFKAGTGRWGGAEKLNQQNLAKRTGDITLRRSMKAPKGFWVGTCDLSQIEARRMADHAGQFDLLQQFANKEDPYANFATALYGYTVTKDAATKTERNVGKECVLSLQYKAWYHSFRTRLITAYNIFLSEEFAKETVLLYRDKMDRIVRFWNECEEAMWTVIDGGTYRFGRKKDYVAEKGRIILPDGWAMKYEDVRVQGEDDFGRPSIVYLDRTDRSWRRLHSGIVANNVTQGSSARILMWQLDHIRQDLNLHMAGTVHDELIYPIPVGDEDEHMDCITYWMGQGPEWACDTPIECEFTLGPNYGDQMSYDEWRKKYG